MSNLRLFCNNTSGYIFKNTSFICSYDWHSHIFVRWRKPRWAIAPASKLFFIPKKPEFDPEEDKLLRKLNNKYNTHQKSTMAFLKRKDNIEVTAMLNTSPSLDHVVLPEKHEQEDAEARRQMVARFNAESTWLRTNFLETYEAEQAAKLAREREERQKKEAAEQQIAMETVLKLMEESKNFYTEDMKDQIEKMLETVVNYNFVIDLDGNRFVELEDYSLKAVKKTDFSASAKYDTLV